MRNTCHNHIEHVPGIDNVSSFSSGHKSAMMSDAKNKRFDSNIPSMGSHALTSKFFQNWL